MAPVLSPGTWLARLEARLDSRWMAPRDGWGVHDAYFEGDHRLAFATASFREAFGSLFAAVADNWMPLVVESTAERLKVQGLRVGTATSADPAAWDLWQANGLDAEANMVHTEAVKLGEAYWLVAPAPRGSSDPPTITCEHPSQVIVAKDPANRRKRLAALKKWRGEDGYAYAVVYTPEWIANYRSAERLGKPGAQTNGQINWRPDDGASGPNPLKEVPVIPMRNAPTMTGDGVSDLKVVEPIQDVLNKLLSDMLIGSEYQAFPQRVLLGVEEMKDENGQPITAAQMQASKSRVWRFSSPDAKIAEFNAADLKNYVDARQHMVRGLTAKTRTPPHYVLGEIINASGDAMTAAETGLVRKTDDKKPALGEGHEDMMRLAFKADGDKDKAAVKDMEVVWKDSESRSLAQTVDAVGKLRTQLDLPQEMCWEMVGLSPTQISRAKTLQMAERLMGPEALPGAVTERISVAEPNAVPDATPEGSHAAPAVKPAA